MSSNVGEREEGEPHLITMGPFSFSLPRSCRHCAQKEIVAAARAKKRRNHVAAWLMSSQSNLSVCSQSLSRTEATGQPSTQGAGFRGKNDAPTSLTQCVWQVPCDFLKQSPAGATQKINQEAGSSSQSSWHESSELQAGQRLSTDRDSREREGTSLRLRARAGVRLPRFGARLGTCWVLLGKWCHLF